MIIGTVVDEGLIDSHEFDSAVTLPHLRLFFGAPKKNVPPHTHTHARARARTPMTFFLL